MSQKQDFGLKTPDFPYMKNSLRISAEAVGKVCIFGDMAV